ncbi:MAG: hypothetical protein ACRBBK_02065 [Paracoccaceae bacterium]
MKTHICARGADGRGLGENAQSALAGRARNRGEIEGALEGEIAGELGGKTKGQQGQVRKPLAMRGAAR